MLYTVLNTCTVYWGNMKGIREGKTQAAFGEITAFFNSCVYFCKMHASVDCYALRAFPTISTHSHRFYGIQSSMYDVTDC